MGKALSRYVPFFDKTKVRPNPLLQIQPADKELRFSADAAYLLVGCLGGLGRSLTTWMMEKGCRNFAFISRSGVDKPEAAKVVESITEAGASAQVFRADATIETDVAKVVSEVNASRPIRGVVHAAMVLQVSISNTHTQAWTSLMIMAGWHVREHEIREFWGCSEPQDDGRNEPSQSSG